MSKIIINLIKFYQYLSHSILRSGQLPLLVYSDCKFYPTCSDYAIGAISKHGVLKGSVRAIIRILKCNPLSRGGVNVP